MNHFKPNFPFGGYPKLGPNWSLNDNEPVIGDNNERMGGFLLPFLTGAVVSAPFWYIAGNNKYCKGAQCYQQQYYQNQPYPMYYPYQTTGQTYPSYYPYPAYR